MLHKNQILFVLFIVGMSCSLKAMDEPIDDATYESLHEKHGLLLTKWRNDFSIWFQTFIDREFFESDFSELIELGEKIDRDLVERDFSELIELAKKLDRDFVEYEDALKDFNNNMRAAINMVQITGACFLIVGICRYVYKKYCEYKKKQPVLK